MRHPLRASLACLLPAAAATCALAVLPRAFAAMATGPALWPIAQRNAAPERIVVKLRRDLPPAEAARLLDDATAAPGHRTAAGRRSWRALLPSRTSTASRADALARRARRAPAGRAGADLAGTYVVDLPAAGQSDETLRRLAADARVEYAQRDHGYEVHYVPPSQFWPTAGSWGQPYDDLWPLKKMGLESAWDLTRGAGAIVAVVDSGVDVFHPDLFGHVWENGGDGPDGLDNDDNGFADDGPGWSFVTGDGDVADRYGHGTHIAGLVAASAVSNGGMVGVAPEALVMPVKVVDDGGRSSSARVAAGIVYAADNGADVAVVASGCAARCPSDPVVEHAIRYATGVGMLVVVSAGNRGDDVAFYSPQNMVDPKPLVVSATTHVDTRASFGSFGDLVDLSAPGGGTNTPPPSFEPVLNILSTRSSTCSPPVCPAGLVLSGGQSPGPWFLRRAGTSMAAAHVAGVAALLVAQDPLQSLHEIRLRLLGNSLDLGPAGHDAMFGAGRLNAQGALQDTASFVLARIEGPAAGQTVSGSLRVVGAAAARAFVRYEVTVGAGPAPTAWEATGLSVIGEPTVQGDLARWSTDAVADGPWTLRLVVEGASGARREVRRTVVVDNSRARRDLVVDVATESEGIGSVQVTPPRASCDGSAAGPQRCTYSIDQGATVTLTALADPLSTFGGWSGACAGLASCTVTLDQARQVRALFKGPRRLVLVLRQVRFGAGNLVVSPGERVCNPGETCTFRYKIGTVVTLRAFPFDPPALPGGTSFSWDPGQPCEALECTLTLDDHLTLRGEFAEQPEEISVGLCCSQTVPRGTVAYLLAFPSSPDGTIVSAEWFELLLGPEGSATRVALGPADPSVAELFLETPEVGVRYIGLSVSDNFGQFAEGLVEITVVEAGAAAAAAPAKAPPAEPLWPLGPAGSSRLVVKLREGTAGRDVGARLVAKITGRSAAGGRGSASRVFGPPPAAVAMRDDPRRKRAPRGAIRPRVDRIYVVDLPAGIASDDALRRLSSDPEVDFAQVDHSREVQAVPSSYFWNLAGSWGQPYDDLWALKKLDLVEGWDQTRGENVTVAVVDSGVDIAHPDLVLLDNPERNPGIPGFDDDSNGYVDDVNGWNFVAGDNDVQDRYGHGTHVAGIVAADPERRSGLAGVAPRVSLLAVKAVDDGGRSSSSRLAAGIVYAVDKGADIVLVPSGCGARCPTDPVMEDAVRYAAASGVLVIVPAGNQGDDARYYSPQNMLDPRPIVVAATDQLDRRESFSNFGEFVDLAAPGGGTNVAPPSFQPVLNILSTRSSTCAPAVCPPGLVVSAAAFPDYLRRAGSSMAAAYATGVAALVLSLHPEAGVDDVRRRLLGNALDLGPPFYDPMFGSGRLQGGAALADTTPFAISRILSPAPGEAVSGLVRIVGTADARSLTEYSVEVGQGESPPLWTRVLTAGEAIPNGEVAIWDTSGTADGTWTIRLTVVDAASARRVEVRRTVTVDNSRPRRLLTLDVAADQGAAGSVEVVPPRAFCDAVSATTHTCSYTLPSDASATLTALPGPLSVFAGWSGACTGTGTCTVSMAEPRAVRATFRRAPTFRLTVSLRSSDTAIVQVSPPGEFCNDPGCAFDYRPGTVVRLQTPYAFSIRWDPGPCEGQDLVCTLTMDRDIFLSGERP